MMKRCEKCNRYVDPNTTPDLAFCDGKCDGSVKFRPSYISDLIFYDRLIDLPSAVSTSRKMTNSELDAMADIFPNPDKS